MRLVLQLAAALIAFAPWCVTRAEFRDGWLAYEKQEFSKAFAEFEGLAKLGHPLSQYMVGIMYSRGEGVSRNNMLAYGWLKLAAEAGVPQAQGVLPRLRADIADEAAEASQRMLAAFFPEALNARLMPKILPNCEYGELTPPRATQRHVPVFPIGPLQAGIEGSVLAELTIATDGSVRDTRIVQAVPPGEFEEAVLRTTPQWRFAPATRDGQPVTSVGTVMFSFQIRGDDLSSAVERWLKQVKERAEAGNPSSQYAYALVLAGHPASGKPWSEALPWITKAAQAGFAPAQFQLGESLMRGRGCIPDDAKAIEWLRLAAQQEYPDAQVSLARFAMRPGPGYEPEKAIFWLKHAVEHDHKRARKYLAAIRAASPEEKLRAPSEALKLISRVEPGDKYEPTSLEIHAAALAGVGDFAKAVDRQTDAIERARKLGWDVAPMQERLAAYRAKQSWTGDLVIF